MSLEFLSASAPASPDGSSPASPRALARSPMERQARAAGARFELREVDIESDEALFRSHLERIPVIELEGAEVCELGLDRGALEVRLGTVSA